MKWTEVQWVYSRMKCTVGRAVQQGRMHVGATVTAHVLCSALLVGFCWPQLADKFCWPQLAARCSADNPCSSA